MIIHGGPGKEKRGEFDQLLAEFWQHYAPQGPVEEMLVERMATLKWRLARVYRSDPEAASERDCLLDARISERSQRGRTPHGVWSRHREHP